MHHLLIPQMSAGSPSTGIYEHHLYVAFEDAVGLPGKTHT